MNTPNLSSQSTSSPTDAPPSSYLYVDASVRNQGQLQSNRVATGYALVTPLDEHLATHSRYLGQQNMYSMEAEAVALLDGLRTAHTFALDTLYIRSDSQPLIDYLTTGRTINKSSVVAVLDRIEHELTAFDHYTLKHIDRDENRLAHDIAHTAFPE